MIAAIICAFVAVVCLVQGAVEGAIAMGILAAVLYFFFGSNKASASSTKTQPKPEKKPQPAAQYRATPSLVAHYRSSPVVAQIVQGIRAAGAEESINITSGGYELVASGGRYYTYKFRDHGYQPLSLQEQEAFLRAIVEQLPHSQTYRISYEHTEGKTTPLRYMAATSYYRDNQYRWNPDTQTWEKMVRL